MPADEYCSHLFYAFRITDIFRVFCADHTYTTVALPYNATAQTIINAAEERVLLGDDCILCEVKSSGGRCFLLLVLPMKCKNMGLLFV